MCGINPAHFLPNGKILIKDKYLYKSYNDKIGEIDSAYNSYMVEQLNTTVVLNSSNDYTYTIMPEGQYYNFTSCVMLVNLTGTFSNSLLLKLSVGWVYVDIFQGASSQIKSINNYYYIFPLLTNRKSHIIFNSGTNTYKDEKLPFDIDIRAANTPFELISNQDIEFQARIIFYFT